MSKKLSNKRISFITLILAVFGISLVSCQPINEPSGPKFDFELSLVSGNENFIYYGSQDTLHITEKNIDITKQRAYTYEVTEGEEYITVDQNGLLTPLSGSSEGYNATITVTEILLSPTLVHTYDITIYEAILDIDKTEIKQTFNEYMDSNYYQLSNVPTIGTPKILVVPVWFTNSDEFILDEEGDNYKELVREDIETGFFGTSEEAGWHSVKSYYYQESFGKFDLQGTVTEWYECNKSYKTVGGGNSGNTTILVRNAVNWYFNNHTEDSRDNYDYDKDGQLDGVILIYAAPDCYQSGMSSYSNFWAYTSWTQDAKNKSKPSPNVYFWCSYDFMYNTSKAIERTGRNYAYGDTRNCNVDTHTFIHEFGHMLGLDDYYDYDGQNKFAGAFSMQDYNVGAHDAYSVMGLGWADPYIPTESGEITIHSFQKTHETVLLTPSWNEFDSVYDEYVLLELYTSEELNHLDTLYSYNYSRPKGPTNVGIRLWHVDARLFNYLNGSITCDATSGRVLIGPSNNTTNNLEAYFPSCNELQLIRNSESEKKQTNSVLSNSSLFYAGDSFSIEKYSKQFNGTNKFDNGLEFNWEFKIKDIFVDNEGVYTCKISLTK